MQFYEKMQAKSLKNTCISRMNKGMIQIDKHLKQMNK